MAFDGERYIDVAGTDDCLAIYQDFEIAVSTGTAVDFSLWVRSPDGGPRTGQLLLSTSETKSSAESSVDQGTAFTVFGPGWSCVESSVVLDNPNETSLRVRLAFADAAGYMIDGGTMRIGSTDPLCPPKPVQIQDGGFEYDAFTDLWQWLPQACPSQIISDPRQAHSGSGFLRVQRPSADCQSFSQDIFGRIPPKTDYTASVWVRSVERQPIDGRLGVWVLNDTGNVGNAQLFRAGPTWQCVETKVTAADGAIGLRPEIYLDALGETVAYEFDDFQIGIGPDFGCPREPQLVDAGFEDEASVAMWQGDPTCVAVIENDATIAHAGEGFLSATKPHPDCRSIYRDLPTSLPLGQDIHIAVWARSSNSTPRKGTLALWAIGGAVNQSAKNQFQVADGQWECLETALTVTEPDLHILRFELYLDSEDEIPLLLDDATVSLSDKPLCPQVNLALRSARILPTQTRFYAGSTLSLETEVRNLGPDNATTSGVLAQWVSATEHGDPIDGNLVVRTPLPKLAANESTRVVAQDIFIPLGLRPDFDYYVVWQVDGDNQVFETNETDNRDSRKIEMTACSTADFYCDVPTGYWAEAGIELWRQHGISGGCRSGTEPFLNRPFCPDAMITRNLMAILLTRQMKGGDYRPHGEYAGTFADVPTGLPHQLELWIEELAETGIDLTGSNCPQVAGERRYCHDLPMTRADLVYTLAQLQSWDLEPITEPVFADVGENQIHAQEINHLQTLGIDISNDPNCPDLGMGPRFCPDDPVRRGFAAAVMSQVFGLAPIDE
ncbi:MAG: hypothetical protein KBG20_15805 [Caldilineaceae bacterium]|nr:hypothetical protein [Caldilineaceae bacterium]MBP8124984.1 hypothetical protein [Caldilineaceae bacterium]MBP9073772.1 hypothetical protein [Caldilineaceae bacterium]